MTRPESTSELPFLHQPVGHIHCAGTETANDHPGYVDGAIESGLRGALEIINVTGGGAR
ncbi:FAD-dependent oxidoreductase [Hoyosella sp. YIM 151337]|uniref:FAD-dependent oxidoreductase n=1 Tax=Hoyosella sp. YIM 151337 TaxID=2992742 RepID=UPI0035A940D6